MTDALLPAPLTTPDCDLSDLPYMPFEVKNILSSDLALMTSGDEFKAAVLLRAASWTRKPAASLPDDPRALARLAGVDFCDWDKVKDRAMQGWKKCADGLLYHPDIAERAMNALPDHQRFQEKRTSDAARKRREREDRERLFAAATRLNLPVTFNTKTSDLRRIVAEAENGVTRDMSHSSRVTGHVDGRDHGGDQSQQAAVTDDVTSRGNVTARKGKGKEESPQPPLGGDRDRFDDAWALIPDKCRGPANMDDAKAHWRAAVASGEIDEDRLFSAVRSMAAAVTASGGTLPVKAFHRWLKLREWQNWAPTIQAPKSCWPGPPHIRDAIIAEIAKARASRSDAEAFVGSWLDKVTTWSDVPAAIVCLSSTVQKKLANTVGRMLTSEFGVTVIVKAAGEAA